MRYYIVKRSDGTTIYDGTDIERAMFYRNNYGDAYIMTITKSIRKERKGNRK